jgi:hypothetical protein
MLREDDTGSLGQSAAFLGAWRMVLWYHGRSRVVPWYCQGRKRAPVAILISANAYTARMPGGMQSEECRMQKGGPVLK